MRKKRLLIIALSILIPSIVVASILVHQGQEPSDGGVADVPVDTTPSPPDTPTPEPTVPPSTPSTLTMLSITEGNVFVMKAGTDSWIEAQVGMSLEPGDIVKSGDGSSAEITFFDGSTIELQAGTEIEVASLDISTDTGSTTISLKQAIGTTISRVTKLVDPASRYEIETPAGVAVVRGSFLILQVILGDVHYVDGTTLATNRGGNIWAIAQDVKLQIPEWRTCIMIPGQPPRLMSLGGGGGGGGGGRSESIVTDLAIDKSDSSDPVDPGTNLVYTLQITNNGPSDSTGAVVLDALPSGVSFVSATDGGTYDSGSHTVSWAIGTIANNASTSFNITVKVNESTPPDIITNTATVDANEHDSDPTNDSTTEDTTINVNDPPVAVDDAAITDEDNPLTIAAPGVLNNDSDPDAGDTLTVTAVNTSGTVGTVTAWNADGSFTYDPDGQFEYLPAGGSTTDSFTYTVSDGHGGTDTATVTITINGVNDAPTDISLDNSSVAENQLPGTPVGDFSTTDPDSGDTFTYNLVSGDGDDDNTSFTIADSQLQTVVSFDYETKNSYSIRVRTTDSGTLHHEEAFTITVTNVNDSPVNDPPVAVDDAAITDEDNPLTIAAPGVLNNDSDPDAGDTLTVTAVNTSGTVGTVTAWDADGSFTYDPNGQFEYLPAGGSTTDSFTYTVSDGHGGTDTATVTITINGVNDAPTDISLDNSSVAENQLPGTPVGDFSTTDPDSGDTFTYNLVSGDGDDNNTSFTIADSQLQTVVSFDYETKNSYSIRVRTTDSGTLYYEEAFTITVTKANDPPMAVDDAAITDEDNSVTVAAPGVLNNDSDPDAGDTLTVTAVNTSGTVGAVTAWNADGSFTYDPNGQFEYLPAGGSTTDSFTYTVSDGNGSTDTATVTITINGVNDPPVAVNDSTITDEDNSVTIAAPGVLNNDSDPDAGDTLTVTTVNTSGTAGAVTAWNADGSFTYDPNGQSEYLQAGGSTTDSFTYTVSDGHGGTDTATVTITINGVNDAPTDISLDNSSVAENQLPGTPVGDFSTTDPDSGDTFTYNLVSGDGDNDNTSFTIADSQLQTVVSFDYETKNSYSIRVRTTDSGTLYYEEAFTITVTNANDPPVALDDSDTTPADTQVTIDVLDNDYDADGDTLTVDSVTQGTNGSVTNNGNDVTYTPDPYFNGTDSFTYTISDGNGGTDTATVTVTVLKTLTRLNIQIDTGPTASIFIWDDTTNSWAIDEDTELPVNGENHVTSAQITIAGGHYYYVWVEAAGVTHYVKKCPKDWIITTNPAGDREAAYGYAPADILYSVHFSIK